MPIGFQSFTPGGVTQIDSSKFTYMLKQKGTLTGTFTAGVFGGGYYVASVTITGCDTPIMFSSMGSAVSGSTNNGGGSWTFNFHGDASSISYALFDIGLSSSSTIGVRLFNSSSQVTFDSNLVPLIIAASGTENIFTNVKTNLPFTGDSGRLYYSSGPSSYSSIAGTEVFPGDFEDYVSYAVIYSSGSNQYDLGSVGFVGSTNDGSKNDGTEGNIPWLIADVTYIDVSNTLSRTLGDITLSGTGSVPFIGTLSSTLGGVTVSGTGNLDGAITGSLSSTLGNVTVSGTGSVPFIGILSSTLGDVTVSGTGSVPFIGSLSSTLGDVTVSGTGNTFVPITVTRTSGTGATETVPTGATSVRIRVGGGGGAGGCRGSVDSGGGGGEGGFCESTIAVIGGNTMTYTVGAAVAGRSTVGSGTNGNSSSVSGTVSGGSVSMTANGGAGGGLLAGGAGGTASGGSTNTTGAPGEDSGSGSAGGSGNSTQSGAGGAGSLAPDPSDDGIRGEIEFYYT
jgi:hypothetical protein